MPFELDAELLSRPIEGRGLRASTLGGELGSSPTLVVALRHPG